MAKKIEFELSGKTSNKDTLNMNESLRKIEDDLNNRVLYRNNIPNEPNSMQHDILLGGLFVRNLNTANINYDKNIYPEVFAADDLENAIDNIEKGYSANGLPERTDGYTHEMALPSVPVIDEWDYWVGTLFNYVIPYPDVQYLDTAYFGRIEKSLPPVFADEEQTIYSTDTFLLNGEYVELPLLDSFTESQGILQLIRGNFVTDGSDYKAEYALFIQETSGIKEYGGSEFEETYGITRQSGGGSFVIESDVIVNWGFQEAGISNNIATEGGSGFVEFDHEIAEVANSGKKYLINIGGNVKLVEVINNALTGFTANILGTFATGATNFVLGPNDSEGNWSLIYTDDYGYLHQNTYNYLDSNFIDQDKRDSLGLPPISAVNLGWLQPTSNRIICGLSRRGPDLYVHTTLKDGTAPYAVIYKMYPTTYTMEDGSLFREFSINTLASKGRVTLGSVNALAPDMLETLTSKRKNRINLTSNRFEGTSRTFIMGTDAANGEAFSGTLFSMAQTPYGVNGLSEPMLTLEKIEVSVITPFVLDGSENGTENLVISETSSGNTLTVPLSSLTTAGSFTFLSEGPCNYTWEDTSKIFDDQDNPTYTFSLQGSGAVTEGQVSVTAYFGWAQEITTLLSFKSGQKTPIFDLSANADSRYFGHTKNVNMSYRGGSPYGYDFDMAALTGTLISNLTTQQLYFGTNGYQNPGTNRIQYTYVEDYHPDGATYP